MEIPTLKAEKREGTGTRRARTVRHGGRLPAVVYGHGEAPENLTLDRHDTVVALKHGARTLQLDIGGAKKQFLIKEVQYDTFGVMPIHLDLMRVDLNERVRVKVSIELKGTPKGASEGGVLDQVMSALDVECLVTEIPDTLHPAVTHLGLLEALLVKDLVLPPGVKALADPEDRVAVVRKLGEAAAEAAAPVAEGEEAVQEPERIGRVRKDETEEEA